jgi:uncharacterized OB-fold protein
MFWTPGSGESEMPRPRPLVDDLTRPFWELAKQNVLAVQRCKECGRYQHPPRPLCLSCFAGRLDFEPVSGRARLWSYTVTRHPLIRGFEGLLPYVCLVVQLQEQPDLFMVSDWRPDPHQLEGLRIGMPMRVVFERVDHELVLPQFRPEATP